MASRHHTNGRHARFGRWPSGLLAALLCLGVTAPLSAQNSDPNDDPTDLTVPDSFKRGTENPLPPAAVPEAARQEAGEETSRQQRIVGDLVSVEGNTLTIRRNDQEIAFKIPAGITVTRDGNRVPLDRLQPKDVIRIDRGVAPESITAVVAVSPAPAGERDPDLQLRSERRQVADQTPPPRAAQEPAPATGGRVWVVMLESNAQLVENGLRPGDVLILADRAMLQRENALQGLASGLFPLRVNADGEVIVSPNASGVNVLGTDGIGLPTGVTIGVGAGGVGVRGANRNVSPNDPRRNNLDPDAARTPRSTVGDQNFGPAIGDRPGNGDRNFGPGIGDRPGNADRNFGGPIGPGPQTPQPQVPQQQLPQQQVPQQQTPQQQAPQQQAPQQQVPQAPPAP